MRSLVETIEMLKAYLKQADRLEKDRLDTLADPTLPAAFKDERDVDIKKQIGDYTTRIDRLLRELTHFPPFHDRHGAMLREFHKVAPYDTSVFIMTKFPDADSDDPRDAQLAKIIETVRDAIAACGHSPRIASEANYHNHLWDNVELHLLGCSRGVAIVEDKHSPELNPNVAMEWGWMVGMGRRVLYLVEKDFKRARADWGGLIKEEFSWDDPGEAIRRAVHKFLGCQLAH